jgi:hypothetical protein
MIAWVGVTKAGPDCTSEPFGKENILSLDCGDDYTGQSTSDCTFKIYAFYLI